MKQRIRAAIIPVSDERPGEKRPWASVAERLERQGERNGRCIGDSHLHYANGIVGISQGHNVFTNTLIYAALPEFYAILGLVGALMV